MEEIEVPVEQAQEHIMEHAQHGGSSWFGKVALTSALLAVCAAIAALMAGHHANEAMIEQIQASDNWGYYQAKGVKASVLQGRMEIIAVLGKEVSEKDKDKAEQYKKDQEEISEKAKEKEASSAKHMTIHQIFARAVTLFQVAIAISAIAVLTRRKRFWYASVGFGVVGAFFLLQAFLFPFAF